MKLIRLLTILMLVMSANALRAQSANNIWLSVISQANALKADKTADADDGSTQKVDSLQLDLHKPRQVRMLGDVSAIDTLPTTSDELKIILFNDNTWRYVRVKPSKRDEKIFSQYWNTSSTLPYYGITAEHLPESVAIELVDSLSGYHYPYKGWMSSKYGPRGGRGHQGVDLPLKTGDPVYATFDGKVRYSAFSSSGYGNLVVIRHNNGLVNYYDQLSERMVESGEWVVAGQQIGKGGSTGRSSGPHLHFETRYMGQSFDPERLFDFKTGELRRSDILLKRRYFSINSRYEQDFNKEVDESQSTTPKSTTKAPTTSKTSTSTDQYHIIKEGDTFGHLAVKYNTTSKRIQELNPNVDPAKIQIGQKIRVKAGGKSSSTTNGNHVYHTIKEGDTFGHLAVKYNTTSKRIQELNPKVDPARIQIGQKIRVK